MPVEKEKRNWFWPTIVDVSSAKEAAKGGFWAALFVAVVTAIVATIAMVGHTTIMGAGPWAYVDAALFGLIAWKIKSYSKFFAVAGIVLFIIEKLSLASSQGATGLPLALIILLMFINGARGVFAYHRLSVASPTQASPVR